MQEERAPQVSLLAHLKGAHRRFAVAGPAAPRCSRRRTGDTSEGSLTSEKYGSNIAFISSVCLRASNMLAVKREKSFSYCFLRLP